MVVGLLGPGPLNCEPETIRLVTLGEGVTEKWSERLGIEYFEVNPYLNGVRYAAALNDETNKSIRARCVKILEARRD